MHLPARVPPICASTACYVTLYRIKMGCLEDTGYSGLLRCHPHIRLRWCLSHVKGHSSHALLRGLDGVTLVMGRMMWISPQPLGGEGVWYCCWYGWWPQGTNALSTLVFEEAKGSSKQSHRSGFQSWCLMMRLLILKLVTWKGQKVKNDFTIKITNFALKWIRQEMLLQ